MYMCVYIPMCIYIHILFYRNTYIYDAGPEPPLPPPTLWSCLGYLSLGFVVSRALVVPVVFAIC